jgi:hypothetical protein
VRSVAKSTSLAHVLEEEEWGVGGVSGLGWRHCEGGA